MSVREVRAAQDPSASSRHTQRAVLLVWLAAALGCSFTLLVYYPGYMSNDSFVQLRQARSGVLDDSHPPLMAAVWSAVDLIWPGPAGMLALQNLLFWGGLALVMVQLPGPRALHAAGTLLIGLYPPLFGLLGTIWKDELMLGALVLAMGIVLRTHQRQGGLAGGVLVGVVLVFATGMRHNAIVAVPPLLFWLLHAYRRLHAQQRVWTGVRIASLALAGSFTIYLVDRAATRLLTDVRSHQWQCVAIYDLVGMSVHTERVLIPPALGIFNAPLNLERLKMLYTPRTSNPLWEPPYDRPQAPPPVARIHDPQVLTALRAHWLRMIRTHPGAYWRHRWDTFRQLIGAPPAELYGPVHWNRINENDLGIVFHESWLNTQVMQLLRQLTATTLYRVWAYLLTLGVFVLLGGCWYVRTGHTLTLALSASGLLYLLAYLPTTPSASFRYSNWSILTALLVLWALLAPATHRLWTRRHRGRHAANLAPPAGSS